MKLVYGYLLVVSLIAVVLTCRDKLVAKRGNRRIGEKTLFTVAFLGGSAAMYLTMLLIRHKTRHKRFMLGLPAMLLFQLALLALLRMGLPQG